MVNPTVSDVYAIIPVRELNKSKSRLANILTLELRKNFIKQTLLNVIKACLKTEELKKVVVVSPDVEVLRLSRENGAEILDEEFERGVNGAISFALEKLNFEMLSILILPSDLPLITSDDLSKIISISGRPPSVVIAPSSRMDGTNALLLNPADVIKPFYDQDSFSNHLTVAVEKKVKTTIYISRNIILDIDTPKDLKDFLKCREACSYGFIREHMK